MNPNIKTFGVLFSLVIFLSILYYLSHENFKNSENFYIPLLKHSNMIPPSTNI